MALHYHRGAPSDLVDRITSEGGTARAFGADLSAPHTLIEDVMAWAGRLDGLVNNAGIQPVVPLAEMSLSEWQAMLDTNLTSAFTCTQAAARVMTGGSITHIASIEATQPALGHAHYSAAKAALVMHARNAALEYAPIRVNTVSPGLIDHPGLDWPAGVERWQAAAPLGRLGTPEDVGNACVFLASPMASWITGHNLVVDGGVSTRPTW
ncbi:SDR family oxidoreductase [Kibdelosporangium lantanae]